MKFIWAFLEALCGLGLIGLVIYLLSSIHIEEGDVGGSFWIPFIDSFCLMRNYAHDKWRCYSGNGLVAF